jgi:glycosyltransferase involved in cell wall biosynthesis
MWRQEGTPRILFVSAPPLECALGGAKPFVELASEFERLGWQADLLSLAEQVPGDASRMRRARAEYLRGLLVSRGSDYDVVDFDHEYLPYAREEFPPETLLVARSVLLCHQVAARSFPRPWSARRLADVLLKGRSRRANISEMSSFASRSVGEADLVNVSNDDDADLLVRSGVEPDKVVVFPYGLGGERRARFAAMRPDRPHRGVVAFVGAFDWRKGAADMPAIVKRVVREAPCTHFRLLGTRGMFPTARDVLRRFPARVRPHLEVVPFFDADELPRLLEDCALGFLPSYLEGFPFAVLEMLAASLPVVAYDVPGPRMMLDREPLVPPGDTDALATRILALLHDPSRLLQARVDAGRRAQSFRWEEIAEQTAAAYAEQLARIRSASSVTAPPHKRAHAAEEIA